MGRKDLNNKVVAITGGAQGIGKSTAEALVARGARVAIGDIDIELAEKTAASLGGGTIALHLNVTDRESFQNFFDETEAQLGHVDVLLNNAGIMPICRLSEESDEAAARMIDINLNGVLIGTKIALKKFEHRGGHIINVASQAGKIGVAGLATYCATKFAVVGLCESLRAEVHGTNIDVSCVMPAVVNTQLTDGIDNAPKFSQIEPEDVANAIVGAIEKPRAEVFVPRVFAGPYRAGGVLPPRLRDAVLRAAGGEHIMLDAIDTPDRAAYEARAAASESVLVGSKEYAESQS